MDERARELERRARGGDEQAEARHLRGRVRAGELPEQSLVLAAYLGHAPAARAVERRVAHPEDDARWFERLAELGDRVLARAGLAVARAAWRTGGEPDPAVLDRAAALLARAPGPELDDGLEEVFDGAREVCRDPTSIGSAELARGLAVSAAVDAAVEALRPTRPGRVREEAAHLVCTDPRRRRGPAIEAGLSLAQARAAVVAELVPALLGTPPVVLPLEAAGVDRAFLEVEAAARDLRRQVTKGAVPAERLALAAFLGDEAARAALGSRAPRKAPGPLVAWLEALGAVDTKALALACLVIVEACLARARKKEPWPEADDAVALARRSLDAPLSRPDEKRLRALREAVLDRVVDDAGPLPWAVHAAVTGLPPEDRARVVEAARARKLPLEGLKGTIADALRGGLPAAELPAADHPLPEAAPSGWQGTASKEQLRFIRGLAPRAGVSAEELPALLREVAGKDAPSELDSLEASRVLDRLQLRYLERLLRALGHDVAEVVGEVERLGDPGERSGLTQHLVERHEAEAVQRGLDPRSWRPEGPRGRPRR